MCARAMARPSAQMNGPKHIAQPLTRATSGTRPHREAKGGSLTGLTNCLAQSSGSMSGLTAARHVTLPSAGALGEQ